MFEELAGRYGRVFQPGDVLFREGDPGDRVFVIQSGAVRIVKEIDGQPTVLAQLSDGEFVGELALINDEARSATAVALEATQCLEIDPEGFEAMVIEEPEIAVQLIRGLARRLHNVSALLGRLAHRDSRTRVVMALIQHAEASAEHTSEGTWIPNKRMKDIGSEVAVSPNELGEISKHLLRDGLLRLQRGGILVPDVRRLYEFVKSGQV